MTFNLAPHAVPLDWLTCTFAVPMSGLRPFNGDQVELPGDLTLHRHYGRTKVFNRIDELKMSNGRRVGIVASDPHSNVSFRPEHVQLKLDNGALYDQAWVDLLTELVECQGWEPFRVDQLDIAADGYDMMQPFHAYRDGRVIYGGRAELVLRDANNALKAAEIGNRGGNKFARCYNKSRELKITRKAYVRSYWRKLGLPDLDTVQRLEVSVKGRELRRYVPQERTDTYTFLQSLTDPHRRAELYQSMMWTLVRFKARDGATRRSRSEDAVRWTWDHLVPDPVLTYAREPRPVDIGEVALKTTCRILFLAHLARRDQGSAEHDDPGGWKARSCELATAAGLGAWWRRSLESWHRSYLAITEQGNFAPQLFDNLRGTLPEAWMNDDATGDP